MIQKLKIEMKQMKNEMKQNDLFLTEAYHEANIYKKTK